MRCQPLKKYYCSISFVTKPVWPLADLERIPWATDVYENLSFSGAQLLAWKSSQKVGGRAKYLSPIFKKSTPWGLKIFPSLFKKISVEMGWYKPFLKVAIPLEWILSLLLFMTPISNFKWCACIIQQQSCQLFNLQMVPLRLESWTSQRHHPVRGVKALVLEIWKNCIYHEILLELVNFGDYVVFKWELLSHGYLSLCGYSE